MLTDNQAFLISTLTENGFKILRITENESQNLYSWWITNEWIPYKDNISDSPFHMVVGYEINHVMNQTWVSNAELINKVRTVIEDSPVLNMRFSPSFKWKEYFSRSPKMMQ